MALFHVVFGTAAAAAGAAALNQWWERRADALMRRTRTRPIPAGRMPPLQAFILGIALPVFGVGYLAIVCNALSAALAAITIAIYILAYTPLKRASTANTAVGAIPGAIPPMIVWAAARGRARGYQDLASLDGIAETSRPTNDKSITETAAAPRLQDWEQFSPTSQGPISLWPRARLSNHRLLAGA